MISEDQVSELISDNVYLESTDLHDSVEVSISNASVADAATAVVDAVNEEMNDDLEAVVRDQISSLESSINSQIKSGFDIDLLHAYTNRQVVRNLKSLLKRASA